MADTFKGIITADGKKRQLPYNAVFGTPASDPTLSLEGAFADSKAVGDKFKEVKTETDSLKEDLGDIGTFTKSSNLINPSELMYNYSIGSDGNPVASDGLVITGKIKVDKSIQYVSKHNIFYNLYLYDNDIFKGQINTYQKYNNGFLIDLPSVGADFNSVIICYKYSEMIKPYYFGSKDDFDAYGFVEYYDKFVFGEKTHGSVDENMLSDEVKGKLNNKEEANLLPCETIEGVINWNGKIGTISGFNIAKFKLTIGQHIKVYCNPVTGDTSHIAMGEYFYNDTILKKIYNATENHLIEPMEYTATKAVTYIWVIYKETDGIKATVSTNTDVIYNGSAINQLSLLRYRFSSAICVGDSLTVGKQPGDTSRDNYPLYLSRMTGMRITNAGQSGATAKAWWDNWQTTYNYADYDCAFICLGTNGGVVKDSDNYNAYISIIDKMQADNPNIAIFLLDCVGNNSDGTDANEIIKGIADAKGIDMLNVFLNDKIWLAGVNGQPQSPTHDMKGDPTHLSPMGYLLLANNVVREMCRVMFENMDNYNQRFTPS
jgi:lysophospholipase L1-like esterase